ncbi:hypothetical protein [Amycolatopsis sp. WAC 01376]|uniref:hypothetical protein n=1 Tax=Amycolatopsis sp. WAC 01376 TaxID=2203195 RepID=UPI001F345A60|nr:hypothetical protein [Amycolatopsis sp. WAC 01376]
MLSIIETALRDAGSSLVAVVRTVTYVTDIKDAELEVSALLDPKMKVEIEAYAIEK